MLNHVKVLVLLSLFCGCAFGAAGQTAAIKISDFATELWSKCNVTVTTDPMPSPDGTETVYKVAVAATAPAYIIQTIFATAPTNTFSIYTKKGNLATAKFLMRNGTSNIDFTPGGFDYDAGVITGGGWTVEKLSNGWFKLTYTNSATEKIAEGNSVMLYAGYVGSNYNAGDFIYVCGAAIEPGASASSQSNP